MPFKRFPDEDGEAQAFPVSFGPSAPNVSDGHAAKHFKKAGDSEPKPADGFFPRPNSTDNSRCNARNKSPSRAPAAAMASSPSRTHPLTNGTSLSPPRSFNSSAHDQAVQTEPTLLPARLSPGNMVRSPQKANTFINNSDLSKSPSKFLSQDERIRLPGTAQLSSPTAPQSVANTQSIRSSSGMREPRARNVSPQETASRFFSSALQRLRPIEDGSAVPLSVEQQRDEIAKGRRLRRFNDPVTRGSTADFYPEAQAVVDQATSKRAKGDVKPVPMAIRDDMQVNLTEVEAPDSLVDRDWQSTEPILGDCPDMCPEPERLERERKGDLDKLERVDGDRNQTSRDLAVKKYTRTAEKQASLIRPISVLLRTMKHLLHLLDRGYDEELLNLHNFLWDRMRAVRMDLRMQHIFNEQAVLLHEQMIRFHILAMHELCEYAKGEGFSEGFDAHLNIEQMNKASVDLFHMYDDLRKSGHLCASEPEFRGYYALLKLDKHPGYVVEPAELSLDLAKMTSEMRNTREVQFARKVARACRSGNYLAFFRLARDATYLQACLMHAHFSKLRSQAIASLYSGLQRNQGIPIVQVEDWLGMEGEDIEALLEYHGFGLRNYEEPYMVKEGPFLNQNKPFLTRRSKLVEEKRSQVVEDDVLSSGQEKVSTAPSLERISSLRRQAELQPPTELALPDEEMPDYEEEPLQETLLDHSTVSSWHRRDEPSTRGESVIQLPVPAFVATDVSIRKSMQESPIVRKLEEHDNEDGSLQIGKRRKFFSPQRESPAFFSMPSEDATTCRDKKICTSLDLPISASPPVAVLPEVQTQFVLAAHREEEIRKQAALQAEVNLVKVRLLLRKWRERAVSKAEERQMRQQKLEAALSSLHVGLPVQGFGKVFFSKDTNDNLLSGTGMELDFLKIEEKRLEKIEEMWSELDVIDVVASILKQKNPLCEFLCWKLVMCSHVHDDSDISLQGRHDKSGDWLLAKLLHQGPLVTIKSEEIFFSDSTSVLLASEHSETRTPVFYIAKDLHFRHGEIQNVEGGRDASGILFLVSENAPLGDEGRRLHALVNALPDNAKLPLLVLYSTLSMVTSVGASILPNSFDAHALAKLLGMDELDKGKVACWTVLPIMESCQFSYPLNMMGGEGVHGSKAKGYYSEDMLRNGLCWLASKAPMQPNLRCVNIQDLVLEHLQPSINSLSTMEPAHVTPNMCIKAFNEALLKTANDVNSSATNYHLHWPPLELIQFLNKLRIPSMPSPGWNAASYIKPIIEVLSLCQLPEFPLVSITTQPLGSSVSLRKQKAALESALHAYVNQICGSKYADPLTLQAVDGIIQKSCGYKQTGLGRVLIPNWSLIFQQLHHIRLALLSSDPPAVVWVQIREDSSEKAGATGSQDFIESLGPSLDEMIELEYQETVLQRDFNGTHLFAEDKESTLHDFCRQSLLVVARVGESRQANVETLQEALRISGATPEISEVVALPTEGELELERMVSEFCERVDRQAAEVANFEDSEAPTCSKADVQMPHIYVLAVMASIRLLRYFSVVRMYKIVSIEYYGSVSKLVNQPKRTPFCWWGRYIL
ncbi:hypothetical protein GOP47_0022585 [Adiantum capillus-veneris]|uniref:SAC3/GANP/THP3 conserved domain-containing protein n=1 Tax=Adiantum capillus-veneris TaxID=13818 RepID=A0A9D4U5N4_ADICA|nr:hypothetical protein GOP47_0022585 [Adiantum capillus-veneris]